MKRVISFSGGRTSAYLLYLFKNDPDAHFVFMDTGAEHPATYQFIRDIVKHWEINLVCLRVVYNETLGKGNSYKQISVDDIQQDLEPWIGMLSKYGCPSYDMPYCTARMKTEPFQKYCNDKFGKKNYETWLGIRIDETKRLGEKDGIRYLAEISDFAKDDVLDWWELQDFDLGITEHLGNCVFCIKKGLNKVALATKDEPEQAVKWIKATEGSNVRMSGRKHNHQRMYRNRLNLSGVMEVYKDRTRDEMFNKLRSSKRFDTNSCSESCEALV